MEVGLNSYYVSNAEFERNGATFPFLPILVLYHFVWGKFEGFESTEFVWQNK
jgi:hypothetical protein